MVDILHIVKDHGDITALDVVREQGKVMDIAVLLLQDGVLDCDRVDFGVEMYASQPDVVARGVKTWIKLLDYEDMVDFIFNAGKVVCW